MSRTTDDKKLREWLLVRQLDDILGVVPNGDLDEDGERPDFIIEHYGGKLGIEVTEYHSDCREMARHSEQETVVAEARAEHRQQFGVPLMVRVYWNSFDSVPHRQRRELVPSLVATVVAHTPPIGGTRVLDRNIDESFTLPEHIDRIDIHRIGDDPEIDWICVRYGFAPEIDEARLANIIQRKSELVADFRAVDELWLSIGFGGRSVSSWGDLNEAALQATYTSPFDRIFAVGYAPRVAYELRTTRSLT